MSCGLCQCGGQLQPSGGDFTCSSCQAKAEVQCAEGHALHANSSGRLPKHCPECDCSVDVGSIKVLIKTKEASGTGLTAACSLDSKVADSIYGTDDTSASVASEESKEERKEKDESASGSGAPIACVNATSQERSTRDKRNPDYSVGTSDNPDCSVGTSDNPHCTVETSDNPDCSVGNTDNPDCSVGNTDNPDCSVGTSDNPDFSVGTSDNPDRSVGPSERASGRSLQEPGSCNQQDSSLLSGNPANREHGEQTVSCSNGGKEDKWEHEDKARPFSKSDSWNGNQLAPPDDSGQTDGTSAVAASHPKKKASWRQMKFKSEKTTHQTKTKKKKSKVLAKLSTNTDRSRSGQAKTEAKLSTDQNLSSSGNAKTEAKMNTDPGQSRSGLPEAEVEQSTSRKSAKNAQVEQSTSQKSPENAQKTTTPADTATAGNDLLGHDPRQSSQHDSVAITFYVVISPSFDFDKHTDMPCIAFFSGRPHGPESIQKLKKTRLASGRNGWAVTVDVQRSFCEQSKQTLEYKYAVVGRSKEPKYEWIHRKTASGRIINRTLLLPVEDGKMRNSYEQYDLVMLPEKYPAEKKNFIGTIWSYFSESSDDTLQRLGGDSFYGLTCMLPDVEYCVCEKGFQGDDIAEMFNSIVNSIKMGDLFFLGGNQLCTSVRLLGEAVKQAMAAQLEHLQETVAALFRDGKRPDTVDHIVYVATLVVLLKLPLVTELVDKPAIMTLAAKALACLQWKGVMLDLLESKLKQRFRNLDNAHLALHQLMVALADTGNAIWLLAIPLYHMLGRLSGRHSGPDPASCNDREPAFWGIDEALKQSIEKFKRANRDFLAATSLDVLNEAFGQCWLTARTFIAALSEKSLLSTLELQSKLPQDVCSALPLDGCVAAVLYYHVYLRYTAWRLHEDYETALKWLSKLTEQTSLYIDKGEKRGRLKSEARVAQCILERELPTILWKSDLKHWNNVKLTIQLVSRLRRYNVGSESAAPGTAVQRITSITDKLSRWLFDKLGSIYAFPNPDELQMWEEFSALSWHEQADQRTWDDEVKASLNCRVEKMSNDAKVRMYCETNFADGSRTEEIFASAAFQTAESFMKSLTNMPSTLNAGSLKKYGKLFSHAFDKKWNPAWTDVEKMAFMLNWPQFPRYVDLACQEYTGDSQHQVIDRIWGNKVVECISLMTNFCSTLLSGEIKYCDLGFLLDQRDNFIQVYGLLFDKGQFHHDTSASDLSNCLELRSNEKSQFDALSSNLKIFATLCERLQHVELHDLKGQLSADISQQRISSLWVPGSIHKDGSTKPLDCCWFPMTQMLLPAELLNCIKEVHNSMTFFFFWKAEGMRYLESRERDKEEENNEEEDKKEKEVRPESDVEGIVKDVWPLAYRQYKEVATPFLECSATFKDADRLLEWCKDSKGREVEIGRLVGPDSAPSAIKLMQKYSDLCLCYEGAELILEIKKEFCLTGDFDALEFIVRAKLDKTTRLSDISLEQVAACSRLQEIRSSTRTHCLKAFLDCKSLIDWVKEHVSELTELKVFVDLASIAAGEGDMEVEKVLCLRSSITGYASLIYELQKDTGLDVFFAKCAPVWKSLETNPRLASQLQDTHRNLEWVKRVKDSYGSVEVTSLAQATAINEKGVYRVGFLLTGKHSSKLTLADVISVKLIDQVECHDSRRVTGQPEAPPSRCSTTYNYGQLCELQSKLMLVAGKAEQDNPQVAAFVKMLTNVTRLATAYINIRDAGSMLFDKWTAELFCEDGQQQEVSVLVHFELSKAVLRGFKDMGSVDHASKLADFMESCIQGWSSHMTLNRKQFPELNIFTTAQIVFLRKELAKFLQTNACDDKVYSMLAMLQVCNERDLEDALTKAALAIKERKQSDENKGTDQSSVQSDTSNAALTADQLQAVDLLVDFGISQRLALRAVWTHPDKSRVDLIEWCQDQPDDDDTIGGLGSFVSPLLANHSTPASETNLSTLTEFLDDSEGPLESTKGNLCSQLEHLWQSFLQKATTSMRDFLSVEHLGHALRCLVATKGCTRPKRNPPVGLDRGRLHLVVCQQEKILAAAVSLYIVDADYPMPTRNEVLVCTEVTSKEEVVLFFERAFADEYSIYCLVYAHRLEYDICSYVEEKIEESTVSPKGYCIIVICAQEYDNQSRMVTALDRFRTRSFHPEHPDKLRAYILKNLMSSKTRQPNTAASLDFEGSCARLVCSESAGVGKTLFVHRTAERLKQATQCIRCPLITVQLLEHAADSDKVVSRLLELSQDQPQGESSRIVHLNISQEVCIGVDELLFNLLILGSLCQGGQYVWQRSLEDYYMIETVTPTTMSTPNSTTKCGTLHAVLELLPSIQCFGPQECQAYYHRMEQHGQPKADNHVLMDEKEFSSSSWQRTFQYLCRLDQHRTLADVNPLRVEGSSYEMLSVLLSHCGVTNPSWSELKNFVLFLDRQLCDCEESAFCSSAAAADLPGFLEFVIKFMLQMSRDFATRSLRISEETHCAQLTESQGGPQLLHAMQMKRQWESSPHPYLFFNPDHNTITFLGFYVNGPTGDIVDANNTKLILQEKAVPPDLFQALKFNKVDMSEDFEKKPRADKISKICAIMGNSKPRDPDQAYELTMDNVKKILAIQMRFRCGIPVVIMGETGCGKTRLIRFMCDLQVPDGMQLTNLVLMKIHGGVTAEHVKTKVIEAYKLAKSNREKCPHVDTVLFLDEANTTDAIGLIKEVMCDNSLDGLPLDASAGLRLIAAVNPYRKHPVDMIEKLESSGLGYHVKADKTTDRWGTIPMRQLVYRVRALPLSMLPLVWDFGQLSSDVEEKYIVQMIGRFFENRRLHSHPSISKAVAVVLVECQKFMRTQKGECSFVSLRDIDRILLVMWWFHENSTWLANRQAEDRDDSDQLDMLTWSLVQALGVCYLTCLQPENRQAFCRTISQYFMHPIELPGGDQQIIKEIELCQLLVINALQDHIDANIARNQALKENVFMMIVCVELRIPLFLVGKPGSSKSLSKSIVAKAMQGESARSDLFKHLKETHFGSFQCSPLATPEGIVATFKQCANYQKARDLKKFVSVVVLDEIGLAEDSKLMPLKTLHPLLEDGCYGDEMPEPHMKCAFIGISNWALDPAKMNRGILVQRGIPDEKDLEESARGICQITGHGSLAVDPIIRDLAAAYLDIFKEVGKQREFFGLRDFYGLMKMVAQFAMTNSGLPHPCELHHAVLRNFGGLDSCNAVEHFKRRLGEHMDVSQIANTADYPPCDPIGLIDASLSGRYMKAGSESRYLLILTDNYAALNFIHSKVQKLRPEIIFGSKFPKDLEYTQVCLNINRIKVCMETGTPVMLLNFESLYESLYDALNQYYDYFGGKRFVDLGLGTHRVKCRVHEDFRLIVVAPKDVVYEEFPIPLKNRLEKHYVSMSTVLSDKQKNIVAELEKWTTAFVTTRAQRKSREVARSLSPADAFIGYTTDTAATVVFQVFDGLEARVHRHSEQILEKAKRKVLLLATPDAVLRVSDSELAAESDRIRHIYFLEQAHESLASLLQKELATESNESYLMQVTTYSKLLSREDVNKIALQLNRIVTGGVKVITDLQAIETEDKFTSEISAFYSGLRRDQGAETAETSKNALLIVQCEAGHSNLDLIACARFIISREHNKAVANRDGSHVAGCASQVQTTGAKCHVVLVIQLNQMSPFPGFHGGEWHCVHVDDLRLQKNSLPAVDKAVQTTVSELLESGLASTTSQIKEHAQPNGDDEYDSDLQSRCKKAIAFDVFELLRMCLHEAASRLRDSSNACERSTQRLKLLSDLFARNGNAVFQRLFATCLVELLQQRENEHMTRDMAENWVSNEAAAMQNVSRWGTFRRSLEDCLEKKLAPTFAAIVAYCDTNCNLDILDSAATQHRPWARKIWLEVLSSLTAAKSDLMRTTKSTVDMQRKSEVPVTCKSANGATFTSRFPFSWLLKQKLDAVLEQTQSMQDTYSVMNALLNSDSEIGCHLLKLSQEEIEDAVTCYASDFIHMSHRCSSEQEHTLVCRTLQATMQQRNLNTISGIHMCFAQLKPRFLRLVRILEVITPALQEAAYAGLIADPLSQDAVDVLALHTVLQNLECSLGTASAKDWPDVIQRCRTLAEEILASGGNADAILSQHSTKVIQECRQMWSRLSAVRIFVEYIILQEPIPPSNRCLFDMKQAKLMLEVLSSEKDFSFKTLTSVKSLEKFLSLCNTKVINAIYGTSATKTKCFSCNNAMESPILLQCRHVICSKCLKTQFQLNNESFPCPQCGRKIPFGYSYSLDDENERKCYQLHQSYKRRFNALLLRILSDLVFDDGERPQMPLVEHVLSYVTLETTQDQGSAAGGCTKPATKQMSPYTDTTLIDPTPVIRSSLLQQLLRSSKGIVDDRVTEYFRRSLDVTRQTSSDVTRQSNGTADLDLCILFINCMEDYDIKLIGPSCDGDQRATARAQEYAMSKLKRGGPAWHMLEGQPLVLTASSLSAVAVLRLSLVICADVICNIVLPNAAGQSMPAGTSELLEATQQLFEHSEREGGCIWPRKFLVKQMFRKHGTSCVHAALKQQSLRHIIPKDLRDEPAGKALTDLFLIGNNFDTYVGLRNVLQSSIVFGKIDELDKHIQTVNEPRPARNALVLLAVCSVVTRTYYTMETSTHRSREVINMLVNFVRQCPLIDHKELCVQLLQNSLPGKLALTHDTDLRVALIALLVIRLWIVLLCQNSQPTTILSPLVCLLKNPRSMQGKFFPTMPHDYLQDVRSIMEGLKTASDNLVMHECPNGHIYYIGDCGRAYTMSDCPECKAPIGGAQHVLASGNRIASPRGDQTKPGHILGPVIPDAQQSAVPIDERDLSPVACTIVRALLHMTLYASTAANGPGEVAPLIQPTPSDVLDFVWKHIVNDFSTLQRALGQSFDECVMFLHAVVAKFTETEAQGNIDWSTHGSRKNWEAQLQSALIAGLVKDCAALISNGHKSVQNDEVQAGRAMALAQILEEPEGPADLDSLLSNAAVWRYRESPSIEHFVMHFENHCSTASKPSDGDQGGVGIHVCLQKFLRSRTGLAAIRHLPSIISLTMLLHREFSRKLDAATVSSLSIEEFLAKHGLNCSLPLRPLIQNFIDAWNIVRGQLVRHWFWFHGQKSQAPENACATVISFNSPLRLLLPGSRDLALCPAALATYLAKLHNDFVTVYAQAYKKLPEPAISITDVQHIHLITADPDKDLLPIILANCEYSLKVGEGTHVQYNFDAIQLQMMDRFVRHKPPLSLPGAGRSRAEIPKFLLREDVTNGGQLEKLSEVLPQSMLPMDMKESICREYRGQVMDLSDSLVLIDRVIGFLVTGHRPPDSSLWTYMDETLRMPTVAHARAVLRNCYLRHVKALWLLLSTERTKVLVRSHQSKWRSKDKSATSHMLELPSQLPWHDWFSGVKDCYAQPLPEANSNDKGREPFRRLCHEQAQGPVIDVLYELLVLKLSRRALGSAAEDEDDAYQPHYRLFYTLAEYVAAQYSDQGELWQSDGAAVSHLKRLSTECGELQLQHAVAVWLLLFDVSNNATQSSKDTKGKAVSKE